MSRLKRIMILLPVISGMLQIGATRGLGCIAKLRANPASMHAEHQVSLVLDANPQSDCCAHKERPDSPNKTEARPNCCAVTVSIPGQSPEESCQCCCCSGGKPACGCKCSRPVNDRAPQVPRPAPPQTVRFPLGKPPQHLSVENESEGVHHQSARQFSLSASGAELSILLCCWRN